MQTRIYAIQSWTDANGTFAARSVYTVTDTQANIYIAEGRAQLYDGLAPHYGFYDGSGKDVQLYSNITSTQLAALLADTSTIDPNVIYEVTDIAPYVQYKWNGEELAVYGGGSSAEVPTISGSRTDLKVPRKQTLERVFLFSLASEVDRTVGGSPATDVTADDVFVGSTVVQLNSPADNIAREWYWTLPAAVDLTQNDANVLFNFEFKQTSKASTQPATYEIRFYSSGSVGAPSATYTAFPLNDDMFSGSVPDHAWSALNFPLLSALPTPTTGNGADLTAVTYFGIFITTQSTSVRATTLQLGCFDIIQADRAPGTLDVMFEFDDTHLNTYTIALPALAAKGFRGTLRPSPVLRVGTNDSLYYNEAQMATMVENNKWMSGMQSYDTEDPAGQTDAQFEAGLQSLVQWYADRGYFSGGHGSYYSNVSVSDEQRYASFKKFMRTMRKFTALQGTATAGGTGTGCTGTCTIDGSGGVNSITLTGGTGYTTVSVILVGDGYVRAIATGSHTAGVPNTSPTIDRPGIYKTAPKVIVLPFAVTSSGRGSRETLPIADTMSLKAAQQTGQFAGDYNGNVINHIVQAVAQGYTFVDYVNHSLSASNAQNAFIATLDFMKLHPTIFFNSTIEDYF